jgi:alginate O-acetyltransferase complex protein AlgI
MVFSSPIFLFYFLPACLAAYGAMRSRTARNSVLLAFSLFFYVWGEGIYISILLFCIIFNYGVARAIGASSSRLWLSIGIIGNLSLLLAFKYADFAVGNVNALLSWGRIGEVPLPHVVLPIGISFFTFQGISYLIDVYRNEVKAEPNLLAFATYKALFPQLIAGPIVRFRSVAHSMKKRRETLSRASFGAQVFAVGLAQKVLIADQVSVIADTVFDKIATPQFAEAWLGVIAYTLQIYFDFMGYSNMAVGLGIIFGFAFPRNFRMPYQSRSISEFWRRWHISLSSWFRDYLYIPLGGNRGGKFATYRNLTFVFLVCGLWHGASWNFVIWGMHHGLFLVLERSGFNRLLRRFPRGAWLYSIVVVSVGWVWFRAADVSQASKIFAGMTGLNGFERPSVTTFLELTPLTILGLSAGCILSVVHVRILKPWLVSASRGSRLHSLSFLGGTSAVLFLLGLSLLTVASGSFSPFLYFRF